MTGRELTSKADSFLNIVAKCLLIFPRSIRVSMFNSSLIFPVPKRPWQ